MATYIVGDIQGCFNELKALLNKANFNPKGDTLYLAGDLVARGPDSLSTLRFVKSLGNAAKVVLGNHDLHLLSVYHGVKKVKKADKLDQLLAADDIKDLMDWLAKQPLIQQIPTHANRESKAFVSHAGLPPQWDITTALACATNAEKKLASAKLPDWLSLMYGEQPNSWKNAHSEEDKFRYTINSLTRMRYCFNDGSLEFSCKEAPNKIQQVNSHIISPWYELNQVPVNVTWLFGHWASLMGQCPVSNIIPLDTGCVWGNYLSMMRWEDKKIFNVPAHSHINAI
ncbi:symmetrical bis(5'-nucleosyl)-tetraphosphatase [Colwellia sp. RSH04]|uniref:symmetrical bis(5'-nucleosyl)-tetraphosphatase n=1 Tax=Colwellia sp. RSH04 TaxID=2305464 RepID=UPI000E57DE96|nr:symmetrical bis(5'-nucleosyl)-tetraphosphatase [Colwellia sp. RSH04]RHW76638.1 symmetrical bis(5'-nucleosyl)-tetraphosphatase [Colwellia sp. RSH04]